MTNLNNGNQFRDEEIVIMSHWDKREEKWLKSIFPKVGGRLRLAHEDNEQMSITTEIVRYDETIAVYQMGEDQARSCIVAGTPFGGSPPSFAAS